MFLTSPIIGPVVLAGMALARNGSVTLNKDTFSTVGCDLIPVTTTATTPAADRTTATTPLDTTTTASAGTTATTTPTSCPFTGQSSMAILVIAVTALTLRIGALRISHGPTAEPE